MCEEYVVGGTSTVEGYRVGQGMGVCKVNGFIIFFNPVCSGVRISLHF